MGWRLSAYFLGILTGIYFERLRLVIKDRKRSMKKAQLYKDELKEWRWRLVAENGKIVADSSEGYHNKQDAVDELEKIFMEDENIETIETIDENDSRADQ